MDKMKFTEEDKKKFIEFVNFIGNKAKFEGMSTPDMVKYVQLLSFIQTIMIPKVEANILEVVDVLDEEGNSEQNGE